MLSLLFALVAQPHFVDCGCLCVDGVPRTLCRSIEEARAQANVCPARMRCPELDDADPPDTPRYFDSPGEHAHNCREVRIWDMREEAYTGVKVCDVVAS